MSKDELSPHCAILYANAEQSFELETAQPAVALTLVDSNVNTMSSTTVPLRC